MAAPTRFIRYEAWVFDLQSSWKDNACDNVSDISAGGLKR